jgi:hypothetical protein
MAPMLHENLTTWLGHPVEDYAPGEPVERGTIYRFRLEWESEHSMSELFASYLADPAAAQTTGLVIGAFGEDDGQTSPEVVQLFVGARHVLPNLTAIFFGDIISEENEISWINQTDISPILSAYPKLEHLVVRGGNGLSLGGKLRHDSLKSLEIQTGGLAATVVHEVLSLDLPNLESLDLWLGSSGYGWDGSMADLQPLIDGGLFPKLKHLGLCNSEVADATAAALASSPLLTRLESLNLSMGTLSDEGAKHFLESPALKRLKKIDLHHHYCSDDMMAKLRSAFQNVNLEDPQGENDEPYVAVGE